MDPSATQTVAGQSAEAPTSAFEVAAKAALNRLRVAVAKLVGSSPVPVKRATDLQRLLGVDVPLGWQVFRLSKAPSPLAAIAFVPRRGPMVRTLKMALAKGFAEDAVTEVEAAYAELEHVIEYHAGDRETFDSMVASLGGESSKQIDLKDRRAAFRANARVWGFHAKVRYMCSIWHASRRPGFQVLASVTGCTELRQMRRVPPITLAQGAQRILHESSDARGQLMQDPRIPFSLIAQFCTQPLPELVRIQDGDQFRDTLRLTGIGRSAPVDCFAYDVVQDCPIETTDPGWGTKFQLRMPAELMIVDLLVPRGWGDLSTLTMTLHGDPTDLESMFTDPDPYRLPSRDTAQHLGIDLAAMHDPSLPRCTALVKHVLDQLEWSGTSFDIFRCRIPYPIMHSMVQMYVDGPKTSASK